MVKEHENRNIRASHDPRDIMETMAECGFEPKGKEPKEKSPRQSNGKGGGATKEEETPRWGAGGHHP